MDRSLYTFVLFLVFLVTPLVIIYYVFKKDPCTGVMALILYGVLYLLTNAIMFIVGTNIESVVSLKVKKEDTNKRPTKEEIELAAIREEALRNSAADEVKFYNFNYISG